MCSGLFSSSANGASASRASAYLGLSTSTRMERSPWTMRGLVGSYCIRSLDPSVTMHPGTRTNGSVVTLDNPRKPKSRCVATPSTGPQLRQQTIEKRGLIGLDQAARQLDGHELHLIDLPRRAARRAALRGRPGEAVDALAA